MSTCPSKELFSAYIDNEIFSPWKEVIDTHVRECPNCRKIYEKYRSVHIAVQQDVERNAVTLDYDQSFAVLTKKRLAVLQKRAKKTQNFVSARVIYSAAATAVLLLCTPLLLMSKQNASSAAVAVNNGFEPILPVSQTLQMKNMGYNGLHSTDIDPFVFPVRVVARNGRVFMVNDFSRLYSCGGFTRPAFETQRSVFYLSGSFSWPNSREKKFFSNGCDAYLKMSLSDVALLYSKQLKRMHYQNDLITECP